MRGRINWGNRYCAYFWGCCLFLFSSCSTMVYESTGNIPVTMQVRSDLKQPITIEGERDFYFWGLYPKKQVVDLDQLLEDRKVKALGKIEIEEYRSLENIFLSILFLGMYTPLNFVIKGYRSPYEAY